MYFKEDYKRQHIKEKMNFRQNVTLQGGTAGSVAVSQHQGNWFNLELGLLSVQNFLISHRVPWVLQFPPTNMTVGGLCAWYNKQRNTPLISYHFGPKNTCWAEGS